LETQFDVIGLGASTVDLLSLVDHFPAQEEVQQAREITLQGGGPVATALVTLARLGGTAAMIDVIGADWRGDLIVNELQQAGVCTDYLQRVTGAASATASILVRQHDGARSIVFYPSTASEVAAATITPELVASAKILHVNGRHWPACLQAGRLARQHGVKVSFDGGAHRYNPAISQLVRLTDICIVARDFARQYTGLAEVEPAAARLLAEGPELVVITAGVQGSWVFPQAGPFFHQPAFRLPHVVDTTGCGDSYHGAFLFGLARGYSLPETAALASAVAALNAQRLGGRGGLPTLAEVTEFLTNL
jgi:sugar/nucleoside kinase (ribokinase family)